MIEAECLSNFSPMNSLSHSDLQWLGSTIQLEQADRGKSLLEIGSDVKKSLYLVDGKLELTASDDRTLVVAQDSPKAKEPISRLVPHRYKVTALTPVKFFWLDNELLEKILSKPIVDPELNLDEEDLENPILYKIYVDLTEDELKIPSLPNVFLKIQTAINKDADNREISQLIQFDPSLAASLLRAANSPLYKTASETTTVDKAITKIGLKALMSYIVNYSVKSCFIAKQPENNQLLRKMWAFSNYVAAMSFVLAKETKFIPPEQAMLLGLLHNIGAMAVLQYADSLGEQSQPELLTDSILKLRSRVSNSIVEQWQLGEEFKQIATHAYDWQASSPDSKLSEFEFVNLSIILTLLGLNPNIEGLAIPDFKGINLENYEPVKKLNLPENSPQVILQFVHDAKQKIQEITQLLSI